MIDILVVLDRSGSMQEGKADHEGGLRSFVEDQKALPGEVRFTMVQFDSNDPCEVVYDRVPMADVQTITLTPRGGTPLYDGVGMALSHLAGRQQTDPSDQKIVMVITDGEDTGGREWTKATVKARITELEKSGWTFLFLGANIDAFGEGPAIGIAAAQSANFSPQTVGAVQAMYATMSNKVGATRVMRSRGVGSSAASASLSFTSGNHSDFAYGGVVKTGMAAIEQEIKSATNTFVDDGHENLNVADDGHTVTVTTTK